MKLLGYTLVMLLAAPIMLLTPLVLLIGDLVEDQ